MSNNTLALAATYGDLQVDLRNRLTGLTPSKRGAILRDAGYKPAQVRKINEQYRQAFRSETDTQQTEAERQGWTKEHAFNKAGTVFTVKYFAPVVDSKAALKEANKRNAELTAMLEKQAAEMAEIKALLEAAK